MKEIKRIGYSFLLWSLILTNTVLASEEVKKSSMMNRGNDYLEAFYAASATLLVILIIWLIIFRPKFNGSDHNI